MHTLFIQQAQGVLVDGDVQITTATLYNCSVIAGFDPGSGRCGAYHLSSMRINEAAVRSELREFLRVLAPTRVFLVHALDHGMVGAGSPREDREGLMAWARGATHIKPAAAYSASPVCLSAGGVFVMGERQEIAAFDYKAPTLSLETAIAGPYEWKGCQFTLIGVSREPR